MSLPFLSNRSFASFSAIVKKYIINCGMLSISAFVRIVLLCSAKVRTAFTASKAVLDCDIATIFVPEDTIGKVGGINPREEVEEEEEEEEEEATGGVEADSEEEVDTVLVATVTEDEDDVGVIRSRVFIRLSDRNHLFDCDDRYWKEISEPPDMIVLVGIARNWKSLLLFCLRMAELGMKVFWTLPDRKNDSACSAMSKIISSHIRCV